GGAQGDAISIPGLEAQWLELEADAERVVLTGRRAFAVQGRPWAPGRPRLWTSGETIQLTRTVALTLRGDEPVPQQPSETVAFAKRLFDSNEDSATSGGQLQCLTGLDIGRVFPLGDGTLEL